VPSEDPGGVVGKNLTIGLTSCADFFIVQDLTIRAVSLKDSEETKLAK